MSYERYAIYWAPEPGSPLARFGESWFGVEGHPGPTAGRCKQLGLDPGLAEAAARGPGRYGLHATLVAPFALKKETDERALKARLECFARRRVPIAFGPPGLTRLGSFLALVPSQSQATIQGLHVQCLFAFDGFREALTAQQRLARQDGACTQSHKLMFAQWGYAHVLTHFRFHITLSGNLSDDDLVLVAGALKHAFPSEPATLDALCLYGDPGGGNPFRLIERFALLGRA